MTLAALVMVAVLTVILLIAAISGFSDDVSSALVKLSSCRLGGLTIYGLVGFILLKTFQAIPAPVKAMQPGPHGQFGGQPQFQPGV